MIEVPSMEDAQPLGRSGTTDIHWLARDGHREPPGRILRDKIASLSLSDDAGQIFLAGEASAVKTIRQDLACRVPQANLHAEGYWLLGQSDHRDGG